MCYANWPQNQTWNLRLFSCHNLTAQTYYVAVLLIEVAERPANCTDQLLDLVLLAIHVQHLQIDHVFQGLARAVVGVVEHTRATRNDLLSVWEIERLPSRIHQIDHGMMKVKMHVCNTIYQLIFG